MKDMDFWAAFAAASAEYFGDNKNTSLKKGKPKSSGKECQSLEFFSPLNGISGFDVERSPGFDEYISDQSALLSLQPWVFRKEYNFDVGEDPIIREDQYPRLNQISPWKIAPVSACGRNKSSLRSRKTRRISTRTSNRSQDSLIPQLYSGNFELEDPTVTPVSSPASTPARSLLITDGNHFGKLRSDQVTENPNFRIGNSKRRCQGADCEKFPKSQESLGRVHFFSLGVCVGIASSLLSSKREMDRFNDVQKQRENLVLDLREELTMKDSLAVRELVKDSHQTQQNQNFDVDLEEKVYSSPKFALNSSSNGTKEETEGEESMREIEAELEAELEKLELCMNDSSVEEGSSLTSEVEPDFVGDRVHGELKVGIGGVDDADHPGGPATPPANYAVSPRQLSLRLHELLQSQLEERIKELEAALHQSHQKLGSSVTAEGDRLPEMRQPIRLKLVRNALESCHEEHEEFQKPAVISAEQSTIATPAVVEHSPLSSKEESVWSLDLGDHSAVKDDTGDDDDSVDDDEDERMLIQQVLERARKGSPVVQNAQKMLSLGVVDCPWIEDL